MGKIKQLKTLLATKDARQLRKDGEELLKTWKEEEDKVDDCAWHCQADYAAFEQ